MKYPRVTISLDIIRNNTKTIVQLCNKYGIKIAGVTKVFCGNPKIAKAFVDGGVSYLADSRIENIIKLKKIEVPKIMLRLPMKSEVDKVVEYTDVSLNSEIETIKLLSEAALKKRKVHNIILMIDFGDLREGYYKEDELFESIENILQLEGIELIGLGTNLTCYGGVIPSKKIFNKLLEIKDYVEEKFSLRLELLSGGNSSTIHLLKDDICLGINHLRLGESLITGIETAYGKQIKDTNMTGFILEAEIIEIKEKPSVPTEPIGRDAFGITPKFVDRGVRKKAICAVGKQDIDFDSIYPIDEDNIVLGGSSDHLILDISDSKTKYKVGDIIKFKMTYVSILRSMTSEFIEKLIID